jgi:hypothetical protein
VSAINNRADIAQQGELNNLMTFWNGTQQSNQMRNQASVLNAQAKSAKKAGGLGSLTSILGAGIACKITSKKYATLTHRSRSGNVALRPATGVASPISLHHFVPRSSSKSGNANCWRGC